MEIYCVYHLVQKLTTVDQRQDPEPETLKLLEESIGNTPYDIDVSKDLMNRTPFAKE